MQEEVSGIELLKAIANKSANPKLAEESLYLFVSTFESKVKTYAEIHASKMGIPADVAFEAIQCAFAKVWKYPTFDLTKSHCRDETKAIVVWLNRIITSQMYEYVKHNSCAQLTEEEDLSIIEDASSFIELHIGDRPIEEKMAYINALESRISSLDEKHRIIYLTYKAYDSVGKKLPRQLLAKLRNRLGITQTTIRVYKREAEIAVQDTLNA